MADVREVKVPGIGDFDAVPVIEVLIKPGDRVDENDGLITLESDKATMEVPAPFSGTVKEVKVSEGDEVSEGTLVALIEAGGGGPDDKGGGDKKGGDKDKDGGSGSEGGKRDKSEASKKEPSQGEDKDDVADDEDDEGDESDTEGAGQDEDGGEEDGGEEDGGDGDEDADTRDRRPPGVSESPPTGEGPRSPPVPFEPELLRPEKVAYASPAVRRFARELGVDIDQVSGSGRKGRITREDVQTHIKQALHAGSSGARSGGLNLLPWPKVDFSQFGETEEKPLSRIKKLSGANLARNWAMIPHVTQHEDADITEMEAFRKQLGRENEDTKLTPLVFLIKAVVAGLKRFSQFNASLAPGGEKLILKKYFHIGIAVDTPDGLVVPVIRDCDEKGLLELARELGDLSSRARDKKLKSEEMKGGCFSISSLGGIGGTKFTPIVNAPEVAILGVSRNRMAPVWDGESFQPRLLLPLSLSYDHRVIDGADAARFAAYLARVLSDVRRLLL